MLNWGSIFTVKLNGKGAKKSAPLVGDKINP